LLFFLPQAVLAGSSAGLDVEFPGFWREVWRAVVMAMAVVVVARLFTALAVAGRWKRDTARLSSHGG